jgi:hypothetical protein
VEGGFRGARFHVDRRNAGVESDPAQRVPHPVPVCKCHRSCWKSRIDGEQAVRVATWVKDHYPAEKFEQTFPAFSVAYWSKGINISKPEGVIKALEGIFTEEEVKEIMKNAVSPENKQRVIELTKSAGAFGAPWIQAVNGKGQRRDWFGNDRWDQVLYHLEVPFTTARIIPPEELEAKAKL